MGAIKTAADTAWRDYEIAGVRASDKHSPNKREVRQVFDAVDSAILAVDAAAVTLAGEQTITGKKHMTGGVSDLPAPVSNSDAARKIDVDSAVAGYVWNALGVDVATTAALPANTYANGSAGVGATLTGNSNGALTAQDGVTPTLNLRILVKNEAAGSHNGPYKVTQVGSVSQPYILTRVTDADTAAELDRIGLTVTGGSAAGAQYINQLPAASITVGTTPLIFGLFGSAGGGVVASQFSSEYQEWVGKINGWPDVNFRHIEYGDGFDGRAMFYDPGAVGTVQAIAGNPYSGNVLRIPAGGSLVGVHVYPDVMYPFAGSYTGLDFSAAAEVFNVSGGTCRMFANFFDEAGSLLGQVSGSSVAVSAAPQLVTVSTTWPAGAVSAIVYFDDPDVASAYVCSLWAGEFSSLTLPTKPRDGDADWLAANVDAVAAPLMPADLYETVDLEFNIYKDNLIRGDAIDYHIEFASTGFQVPFTGEKRLTYTPPIDFEDVTITAKVRGKNNRAVLASAASVIHTTSKTVNAGVTIKVLPLGDSITNQAWHLSRVKAICAQFGQLSVAHIGSRLSTAGLFAFTVSGVTVAPAVNATYANNAVSYRVLAVEIRGGAGVIVASANGNPTSSGTLTKSGGTYGDSSIAFSAVTGSTYAINHEGRSGWKTSDFVGAGRTFYRFNCTGVSVAPVGNNDDGLSIFTNNGSTFTIREVTALGAGAYTVIGERTAGSNSPSSSGTLTKTSGTGDATMAYGSTSTTAGNPLWNGSALNFGDYLTKYSLTVPDIVVVMLGTNDMFAAKDDATAIATANTAITNLESVVSMVEAYNTANATSIKIAIATPPPPTASQDGFGNANGSVQSKFHFKANWAIFVARAISNFGGRQTDRVYVLPLHLAIDTDSGFTFGSPAPLNAHNPTLVSLQNNDVHPSAVGGAQIGDHQYAFLNYVA